MLNDTVKNHSRRHFFDAEQSASSTQVKSANLNNNNNHANPLFSKLADLTRVEPDASTTPACLSEAAYLLEQLQGIIQSIAFSEQNLRLQQSYGLSQASIDIELGFYEEVKTRLIKLLVQERHYFSMQHEDD